jgi:asparagine synthase (glutamine-hydrolysing)
VFFTAYFGTDSGLPLWQEAVAQHARWLGLRARLATRRIDKRTLSLAWLEHAATAGGAENRDDTDEQLVANTLGFDAAAPDDVNAATLTAWPPTGAIRIVVPPATPQQLCYGRTPHGYVFADDLRLFPRLMAVDVDSRGVYALLRYGAIPAPLTLYRQVQRIPNGHEFRLSSLGHIECTPTVRLTDLRERNGGSADPDRWVAETLDATLGRIPRSTVLYFSGGVDSALLAARLVELGRSDVQLVNYSFSDDDEESLLALRVAAHLGLGCHQIRHDLQKVGAVLTRVGMDYSFPFGDLSAIPTNLLVHESLSLFGRSRMVLEGTGADGAYGLGADYGRWRRVYGIPRPLRRFAAVAYRQLRLWRYNSRLERAGRLLSRSARASVGHALVAQNALDRVAYTMPDDVRLDLERVVRASIEVMSDGTEARDQLSWLDLLWVCAGQMAPKSFDVLRAQGIRPLYPFLQPSMVAVSSALTWEEKCTGGEAKALLKRLLVRDVPAEYVYRRKIGFTRPAHATFALPAVQEFLHDVVLSRQNVLLDYCRTDVVRNLIRRSPRRCLGVGAYSFLWMLMFATGWLCQTPAGASRSRLAALA